MSDNKCNGEPNPIREAYTCYGIRILVDFSGSASGKPDIDVFLFDNTGYSSPARSINNNVGLNNYTEQISVVFKAINTEYDVDGVYPYKGDTYYAAVRAWDVPVRAVYKINYGQSGQ